MKKTLRCIPFLLLVILLTGCAQTVQPAHDVTIDQNTFPDDAFRDYIIREVDQNNSGYLEADEIEKVTAIDCSSLEISSLKGIEIFSNLKTLDCSGLGLSELDVSANKKLTKLVCYDNRLTSLDLSNNRSLEILLCGNNELEKLDLSRNSSLQQCSCYNDSLTELNIDHCRDLKQLDCSGNSLTALNLDRNSKLLELNCSRNKLTSLNLSKNKKLWFYFVDSEVSLTGEDKIKTDQAEHDPDIDEYHFPDKVFRKYVKNRTENYIEIFNGNKHDRCNGITKLDVSNGDIYSLKGIEYFTALQTLDCSQNHLTDLNIGKNTELTDLKCSGNDLSELDVSHNRRLKTLECSSNKLSVLDLSGNPVLETLKCQGNNLTGLDLSKHPDLYRINCANNHLESLIFNRRMANSLRQVNCQNNHLSELDLTGNEHVKEVWCDHNDLTDLDLSKNKDLEDLLLDPDVSVIFHESVSLENYSFRDEDLENNAIPVDEEHFPYEYFRNYISNLADLNLDGLLAPWECEKIHGIYIEPDGCRQAVFDLFDPWSPSNMAEAHSLKGVEYFSELESLNCDNCNLSELDVSNNPKLKSLYCGGNYLTELDLSENLELEALRCYVNDLSELDVSKNRNLQSLRCTTNRLEALDVSENPKLKELECSRNKISALDVSHNKDLEVLKYDYKTELTGAGDNVKITVDYFSM